MGPAPPPHAGRWHGREDLWNELTRRDTLAVQPHPHRAGAWHVFDPATPGPIIPMATITDTDLHDLETAGVRLVYRH